MTATSPGEGDHKGHVGALDLGWFKKHLLEDLLPHWLAGAVTEEGLFLPHLDRQWRRPPGSFGTLVSQGRLLFNFSIGYQLTGREEYADAVRAGAEFLLWNFGDPRYGGYFFACGPEGRVLDDRKDSYGHAFVIFGLAHAARCLGDGKYRDAAAETWQLMRERLSDEHGGLLLHTSRDFEERDPAGPEGVASQNPVMHTFEALLALGDVPGAEDFRQEAQRVADFVLERLLRDDGALPEFFTADWGPLSAEHGGRINVGHQFEWAFLLSSAVERGLPQDYLAAAEGLLEAGLRMGFDAETGGVCTWATPAGEPIEGPWGWWEQCEATRAMMHFVVLHGREDLVEPLAKNRAFFEQEFVDSEYGGWAVGEDRHKGDPWKVDYHVVGMCVEALRLSDLGNQTQSQDQ
ncbi:MAG: AGE family epimerase/isomerase [Armatimonadetes bacterium]|nr:AGE family epimerase/isomerase [Armatimonadota bacterium]